jgi:signal transduction histidine kinase
MPASSPTEEWLFWLERRHEEERTRIARELHDAVGANLTLAKFSLARLRKVCPGEDAANLIAELKQRLDDGIRQTNAIGSTLKPGMLNAAGLSAVVESLVLRFCERKGIVCEEATFPDTIAPEAIATPIYRIAENLLAMIAELPLSAIAAGLTSINDEIVMRVSVRGSEGQLIALNLGTVEWGWIALRANHLGGSVCVDQIPPDQSRITVTIPMER